MAARECDGIIYISQAFQPEFIGQPTGVSKQVAKAASQHTRAHTRASTVVAQQLNVVRLNWIVAWCMYVARLARMVAWCLDAAIGSKWMFGKL